MSSSHAIQDISQERKTADGYGVQGGTASAGSATANAYSNNTSTDFTAVNAIPPVVSSQRPAISLYAPLLALATAVEAISDHPQRETTQTSNPEQKPTFRPPTKTTTSVFPKGKQPSPISATKNKKDKGGKKTKTKQLSLPIKKSSPIKKASSIKKIPSIKKNPSIKKTPSIKKNPSIKKAPPMKTIKKIKVKKETPPLDPNEDNSDRIVEEIWKTNYQSLVQYHAIHGDSNVLRSHPNKQLSGWVKRQRNNLKDGKLSPDKIMLLDKLDFVWNRIDGRWYKKFCELVRFQKMFGHCYVTSKYNRSLAEWTQRQRREYTNGQNKMTEERVQKLEALEGWNWEKLHGNRGNYVPTYDDRINIPNSAVVEDSIVKDP